MKKGKSILICLLVMFTPICLAVLGMLYVYIAQPDIQGVLSPMCDIKVIKEKGDKKLIQFLYENGQVNTSPIWIQPIGKAIPEKPYCFSKNDDPFGLTMRTVGDFDLTVWDKNKNKIINGQYKNGERNGIWNAFYQNGMIQTTYLYSQGGVSSSKSWYINGQQKNHFYTKDNINYKVYWGDGGEPPNNASKEVVKEYRNKEGKGVTITELFNDEGIMYQKEKMVGGQLIYREEYEDTKLVRRYIYKN